MKKKKIQTKKVMKKSKILFSNIYCFVYSKDYKKRNLVNNIKNRMRKWLPLMDTMQCDFTILILWCRYANYLFKFYRITSILRLEIVQKHKISDATHELMNYTISGTYIPLCMCILWYYSNEANNYFFFFQSFKNISKL